MASILGYEMLTDDYGTRRIKIAFNPQAEIFEVANPSIAGNPAWLPDIAYVFDPATSMVQRVTHYCQANPGCTQDAIFKVIERLRGVIHNHVGIIDLSEELDIETVTEALPRTSRAMTSVAMTKSDGYRENVAAARRGGARGRAIVAGQTREGRSAAVRELKRFRNCNDCCRIAGSTAVRKLEGCRDGKDHCRFAGSTAVQELEGCRDGKDCCRIAVLNRLSKREPRKMRKDAKGRAWDGSGDPCYAVKRDWESNEWTPSLRHTG